MIFKTTAAIENSLANKNSLAIKNTNESYGIIARWIHWSTALLFLASYCTVYYREWFAETDLENWSAIHLHMSIGITLGVFVILRVIWRLLNQTPQMKPASKRHQLAARIGHYFLYLVMIIMPISGYLSLADYLSSGRGSITFFLLFDISLFKDIEIPQFLGLSLKELEKPADVAHSFLGAWIVWLLILGHIFAALYHHFVRKDNTLIKMTGANQFVVNSQGE